MSRRSRSVRVIAADDHPVVLMAVREMLGTMPGFELVGTASSGAELLAATKANACDLVVTDLVMNSDDPSCDGLSLIRRLIKSHPRVPVVVFTMLIHESIVQHLCRAGVAGIVSKNESTAVLGGVCGEVLRIPPVVLSPDLQARFAPEGELLVETNPDETLSSREREVLSLFMQGVTLSDIATRLKLSLSTVGMQKRSAMRKLRVASDGDLLWVASITGLD